MYTITREIGIDAAHRIPDHRSKCKSLHGHAYRICATCTGSLRTEGEETGMVMDFGFLKEEMRAVIHAPCDHGTILGIDDPFVELFIGKERTDKIRDEASLQIISGSKGFRDFAEIPDSVFGKLYLMGEVPTAENLARHWFSRLEDRIIKRSDREVYLTKIRVHETINCFADVVMPEALV